MMIHNKYNINIMMKMDIKLGNKQINKEIKNK